MSGIRLFPVGTTLHVRAHLFRPDDVTGAPVAYDPATLELLVTSPSGVRTTISATRQSAGNWTALVRVSEAGRWLAEWESDPGGATVGVEDFYFDVYKPAI